MTTDSHLIHITRDASGSEMPTITFERLAYYRCLSCLAIFSHEEAGSEGLREHALGHFDARTRLARGIDHPHADA